MFGTDISCVDDLDPTFGLVAGNTTLAQAILRRLSTPRGGLLDDPDYGYDVRSLLADEGTLRSLTAARVAIANEVEKDERVFSCDVELEFLAPAESLLIRLEVTTARGPFRLVLEASQVNVEILEAA